MGDSWVPIDKQFRKLLPKDRPYTELEAAFCLQLDADNNNSVSVAGYAKLWEWGIKKVKIFFEKMGVTIIYPTDTKNKQNQRGSLKKVEKIIVDLGTDQGTDREQIREQISFIDINYLKENRNRSGNRCRNRSGAATKNPKILDPKEREAHSPGGSPEKTKDSHEKKQQYGEYVLLPPGKFLVLTEKMGAARLAGLIEDVNLYCGRAGKRYKDYAAAILTFDRRDRKANGSEQDSKPESDIASKKLKAKYDYEHFIGIRDKSPEEQAQIRASICKKYKVEDFE